MPPNNGPALLVSPTYYPGGQWLPGTQAHSCTGCGAKLAVSPQGQDVMREQSAKPICVACSKLRQAEWAKVGEEMGYAELESFLDQFNAKAGTAITLDEWKEYGLDILALSEPETTP